MTSTTDCSQERTIASQLTMNEDTASDNVGGNFAGSLVLHAAVIGSVFVWALISQRGKTWGEHDLSAGAIQATMVSALPLPPKQRTLDTGVLTSEKPSPAPIQEKQQTQAPPSPQDLAIPSKPTKPVKTAAKTTTPEPPKHIQPVPETPTKAVTGDTGGIRIPQATMQMKNGTASINVEDRTFGDRYAYYVNIVNHKVAQYWYTQEADPIASEGKRVTLIFDINRDGIPSNVRVGTRSGSPSLDTSALRALQRVQDEGFGPLPQGDHITVEYSFDYRQQR